MYRTALILAILFACICNRGYAQSYIYIQGDKTIPFYVKIDSVMQPRYGKNYCIAANLSPGEKTVQILFQQNAYPPVFFRITAPANGKIGYLLERKDARFCLYDISTHTRLYPLP